MIQKICFAKPEQSRRPHVETFETLGVEIGNETYAFPKIARAFLTPPLMQLAKGRREGGFWDSNASCNWERAESLSREKTD